MDIKLKNYSHSLITKILIFVLVIACFTGAITVFVNTLTFQRTDFEIIYEDNYYSSSEHLDGGRQVLTILMRLLRDYKNEEYIKGGGTVTKEDLEREEKNLFMQFQQDSISYDPELGNAENYTRFKEVYSDRILQIKDKLIQEDMREYNNYLQKLKEFEGIVFFAREGENTFTNSSIATKDYFKGFKSYMVFDEDERVIYPKEILDSKYHYWVISNTDDTDLSKSSIYIGFTDEVLKSKIKAWEQKKAAVTNNLYTIEWFLLGLALSFVYLIVITGRKYFKDKEVHLNSIDKLYTDINSVLCIGLIISWGGVLQAINFQNIHRIIIPVTASIATVGLMLVLSLVRHIKNKTIIKHSLTYRILHGMFKFIKDVYDSGSVGVKVVLIIIVYPVVAAATFFMFPLTIGAAAWLALKQVKKFNAIKEGVERIKNGEIHHKIDVTGTGELENLAANINGIAEGLNKAVDDQLKSERLKTELITNVSHDIRTPLTSIITYVDLLKGEKDPAKSVEYIEVIDQKAQRLRILTDDLFEAAKASSGSIPVNFEKIDIVSLITQGLGELNDKIEALELDFKLSYPKDKVFIRADGKLLWRALENLLSNIFKYALKGSRVYIDIHDSDSEVEIVIKNISAYELNVSAGELMERFKRGDESRSSQGSGLGLSIAKSLVDIQKGNFRIEIDGDLFKAIIKMPAHK